MYIYDMISDLFIRNGALNQSNIANNRMSSKVMRHRKYFQCFQLFVHISNQPCIMDVKRKII